ncbi:MAG: lipopolysaccharide heptosyltransferase II [Deltaproteobacteria bacterium]|nr:lipopolysaccharide heptosyltransferase II [Deltaproteobacteria bacterium]
MKILMVKLSAIGDVVHTMAALTALRSAFPTAKIDWVVEEAAASLVKGHPDINKVMISRRKKWQQDLKTIDGIKTAFPEIRRFVKELRVEHYDYIIDFQWLFKSALVVALARGKCKMGYDLTQEGSYLFLNRRVTPVSKNNHAVWRYVHLAGVMAGIDFETPEPELPPRDFEAEDLRIRLASAHHPLVAINPMAKWDTKNWLPERFSRLADSLVDRYGAEVMFTGSPEDRAVIDYILDGMHQKAVNLAGATSLADLAEIYRRTDLVISTDTGPMHMAAAVGTPVIALFGPTAPWRTGPYGKRHMVVRTGLNCSPCFKKKCRTQECMTNLDVDMVLKAVDRKLKLTT